MPVVEVVSGFNRGVGGVAYRRDVVDEGMMSEPEESHAGPVKAPTARDGAADRAIKLLDYIEAVQKENIQTEFQVPRDLFCAHQHELHGLPELALDQVAGGEDVWLRIPRLAEIPPPELSAILLPWVVLPRSPDREPALKTSIRESNDKGEEREILLADVPEVKPAFTWYREMLWTPWAEIERKRRQVIAIYTKLFNISNMMIGEGDSGPLELVWGMGFATWAQPETRNKLAHPLILQACDIRINEDTLALEVAPRNVDPRLKVDCFDEMGVAPSVIKALKDTWTSSNANLTNRVNPFDLKGTAEILNLAAARLDNKGRYVSEPPDLAPEPPGDGLRITGTWVLFVRRRSGDIFVEDLVRLRKRIEQAGEVPSVIASFVSEGANEALTLEDVAYRGLSSSEWNAVGGSGESTPRDLFFPMPYNEEQVSIAKMLEQRDGVCVQGPPGTGKSHTIANIICHYLAHGRKILVTAKSEKALLVLQDKLPENIRPLTVALLSDERDGMQQFEKSVRTIAQKTSSLQDYESKRNIKALSDKLDQIHQTIASIDQKLTKVAANHLKKYPFQGREATADEIAEWVVDCESAYQWMDDDLPISPTIELPFVGRDIAELRRARAAIGSDLPYLGLVIPPGTEFIDGAALLSVHLDLQKERSIQALIRAGELVDFVDSSQETLVRATGLSGFLEERDSLAVQIRALPAPWVEATIARIRILPDDEPILQTLSETLDIVRQLDDRRRALAAKAIVIEAGAEDSLDVTGAVERGEAGKQPFAFPFGKAEARKVIEGVLILGVRPSSVQDWALVQATLIWRRNAKAGIARWNAIAPEFGVPPSQGSLDSAFREMVGQARCVELIWKKHYDFDRLLVAQLALVFGVSLSSRAEYEGAAFVEKLHGNLRTNLDRVKLAYARGQQLKMLETLATSGGAVVIQAKSLLRDELGRDDVDGDMLASRWDEIRIELTRLHALKEEFGVVARMTAVLVTAGAPKWAKRLRLDPATGEYDPHTPTDWLEAWNWRRAQRFLDLIDGYGVMRQLFTRRREQTEMLARTYAELIEQRAWLALKQNTLERVQQALSGYLNAIKSLTKTGRGKRDVRHRRDARLAMEQAYSAVPCWIMPQWRVSEAIPAELGLFDLIIVDEASQSDIFAMPALMRGKKILVVGDDKQVSPSIIGVQEKAIDSLVRQHLNELPHGAHMTPDRSIYDLAQVVFAGSSVMLCEHFRCVAPIIEFSNREFYQNQIRPLRLPRAHERLDPPLIDVFVHGGVQTNDINKPEAEAIVTEIEEILRDDRYRGRTIGVVTLKGIKQAPYISDLVSQRIPITEILARKISIGGPTTFQGQERDIILLSMVIGPGDAGANYTNEMSQRFNVAMSRAADRMILFRSVDVTAFGENTLNGKVMRHFSKPFSQDARQLEKLRTRCESDFERAMFDHLAKEGYRFEPQVPCGAYRIDFVVEGADGRRLAVECDGDRYHGQAQWPADMARQRVLERAGWTFWRCFGSDFRRRRTVILDDLRQTLNQMGIEPLGMESIDSSEWVAYKEVDPCQILDPI